MIIDSQRINYKIQPFDSRYSRKVQENINASPATFTDLETPGWSSMMRSQISDRTKRTNREKQGNKSTDILNKLKEQKQLIWSRADEKKMVTSKGIDKNQTRDTDRVRHSMSVKQINKQSEKKNESKHKRWNQISVHEYLYENSKKLENKKMMYKILDEQFKKQVYKFAPTLNKKSIILAQSKFSRSKQNEVQIKKQENTMQTEATDIKQKLDKDVERYKILNRTFYFLTQGRLVLTEQCLQKTLLQLPMPCIKVIQPIVTKIYQGVQMQWLDFLQSFNCHCKNGKQGFFVVISKWFTRNEVDHSKGNENQPIKDKCK